LPTPENHAVIEVSGIHQVSISARRDFDVQISASEARVAARIERVSPESHVWETNCSVEIRTDSGEQIFEAETVLRVFLDVEIDGTVNEDELAETCAALSMRVAYPYHRHSISTAVQQAGLPAFYLPLAADSEWTRASLSTNNDEPRDTVEP
jgi:preprotein translocase subunit SecB